MKYLIKLMLIITISSFSQETDRTLNLIKNFKPIDSFEVSNKFKNGKLKTFGTFYKQEIGRYYYDISYGLHKEYYKNGNIETEKLYNRIGVIIYCKWFDKNGNLLEEYNVEYIDSSAKNINEYLLNKDSITIIQNKRIYLCSKNNNSWYLWKEGKFKNVRKIGDWKVYDEKGNIIKIKSY